MHGAVHPPSRAPQALLRLLPPERDIPAQTQQPSFVFHYGQFWGLSVTNRGKAARVRSELPKAL